jgi:exodeoxyribonuclease VII small subunit
VTNAPEAPDLDPAIAALPYDEAFAELQRAIAELEAGGQPLEATLVLYERAIALQRHCERLLAEAELRVSQLVSRAGGTLVAEEVRPEDGEPA